MEDASRYDIAWQYVLQVAYLQGRIRTMVADRYLTDFSSAWKGPKDETGMRDGNASQQYLQAFLKAQHKDDGVTNIEGYNVQWDSETGNLILQSPMPSVQLSKQGQLDLVSFIMKGPPPEMVTQGVPPGGIQAAAYDFSPELKLRHERNWDAMEQWAKASSKAYPKG